MKLKELNRPLVEGKIKDAENALAKHAQNKIDYENENGPMSPADIVSHEKVRKQLLDKKKRAQSAYHKKIDALE